tara:strand:- start:120 stop:914 length:795 start_codon:yes stop_codon:yes gene_type:complete
MKKKIAFDLIYSFLSLIISIILVHLIYLTIIRPNAETTIQDQTVQLIENPQLIPERSFYIIVKDIEQEACFVLMFWAISLMLLKGQQNISERRVLQMNLVKTLEETSILPQDTREYARPIQALNEDYQKSLIARAILTALHRFRSTENIQDASNAIQNACDAEAEKLESELSMIRYIAWAIPSIGFLGTVRGIGQALGQAHQAVGGEITAVTQSLGVAFNSTFVALLISILIMFLMHQLQLAQERLTQEVHSYCDDKLISHLKT